MGTTGGSKWLIGCYSICFSLSCFALAIFHVFFFVLTHPLDLLIASLFRVKCRVKGTTWLWCMERGAPTRFLLFFNRSFLNKLTLFVEDAQVKVVYTVP